MNFLRSVVLLAFLPAAIARGEPATAPAAPILTHVRIYPRPDHAAALKGARITGSVTSATNDFDTLATLTTAPPDNEWLDVPVDAKHTVYRFLKIETANGSWANLAEIEFYAGDARLTGTPFGTTGSRDDKPNTFDKALDGDTATYFEGKNPNSQYVGLDLGPSVQAAPVTLSLPSGAYATPQTVELKTNTTGAVIHYRLDGHDPDERSPKYDHPLTLNKPAILSAAAFKPGLARSVSVIAAYRIGEPPPANAKSFVTFHIGNSLTDTVDGYLKPVMESAGYSETFYRFTIPGAPTDWLWDHPGSGFGESHYLQAFLARAPLGHLFTQPFEGHDRSIANEAEYSGKFFAAAREHSPDLQPWLYAQWPARALEGRWSQGVGATTSLHLIPAGADYARACENHLAYFEAVRAEMIKFWPGKPILVVPTPRAMARAKAAIDAGKVPGESDFLTFYADDVHLTPKGRWFVANVVFACLTHESPEGKVAPLNSGLSPEGAIALEKIAWDVVAHYPLDGVPTAAP